MNKLKVLYTAETKNSIPQLSDKPHLLFNINSKLVKLEINRQIEFDYDLPLNMSKFDFKLIFSNSKEFYVSERKEMDGELIRKIKEYKTVSGKLVYDFTAYFDNVTHTTTRNGEVISETCEEVLSCKQTNICKTGSSNVTDALSGLKFTAIVVKKESHYLIQVQHYLEDPDPGYY